MFRNRKFSQPKLLCYTNNAGSLGCVLGAKYSLGLFALCAIIQSLHNAISEDGTNPHFTHIYIAALAEIFNMSVFDTLAHVQTHITQCSRTSGFVGTILTLHSLTTHFIVYSSTLHYKGAVLH